MCTRSISAIVAISKFIVYSYIPHCGSLTRKAWEGKREIFPFQELARHEKGGKEVF